MTYIHPHRFDGKVAIVTGGASGIGLGIVASLVAEGAKVAVADINQESLDAVSERFGKDVLALKVNVTKEEEVAQLVATTVEQWGGLHVAFNNAGATRNAPIVDMTEAEWDFTVDLCLKAVFLGVKHQGKYMAEHGGGAIVNTSSLNARIPMPTGSPYSSAKAGVEMLSRTAAIELAPAGVRVNSILPGLIRTPLSEGALQHEEVAKAYVAGIPLGRPGEPEELAAAALFLAAPEASFITGTSLIVDGGNNTVGYPSFDMAEAFS